MDSQALGVGPLDGEALRELCDGVESDGGDEGFATRESVCVCGAEVDLPTEAEDYGVDYAMSFESANEMLATHYTDIGGSNIEDDETLIEHAWQLVREDRRSIDDDDD